MGWKAVMKGLQSINSIQSLNGVDELFVSERKEINLKNKGLKDKEAVVAVACLLPRSEKTLNTIDLRCFRSNTLFDLMTQHSRIGCDFFRHDT